MKSLIQFFCKSLWELWCIISIVGIWPRYIEPRLLKIQRLKIKVPLLPKSLDGLKILHLTDLHFSKKISKRFLRKITRKVKSESPDLIVFTGDFICYSNLENQELLKKFLKSLQSPLGNYCTFGNHDYASYVTEDLDGKIDIAKQGAAFKALKRFVKPTPEPEIASSNVTKVGHHKELIHLLNESAFQFLENESKTIIHKDNFKLTLTGLGDLWLGRCHPEHAFVTSDTPNYTIVLSHNPESISLLKNSPAQLILAGHTHGEQVCFPGFLRKISKKISGVTKLNYTRGLYDIEGKLLYVNRGVGCHKVFRWGSIPELLTITLTHE